MLKHLLPLLFMGWAAMLSAQNFTMNGNPVTSCSGSFFDPGGTSGNYANNQSFATTICSDGTDGTHIRLDFPGVALGAGDVLCFFDGNSTAAPALSCAADYPAGSPFVIQATAANPGGCLTVQFTSDGTGTGAGWSAAISCVASCQQVLADLVSTTPAAVPADTGWIDICPGQRVTFKGMGIYPQNDFAYHQSDFSTEFEWNFGDGGIAYGPEVSHKFNNPGGYYVQLFLRDTQGCRSTNLISQRVRVSPRPTFSIGSSFNATICAGDTLQLSSGVNASGAGNVLVSPGSGTFAVDGTRSDSLPLPDGTGIPYQTSLFFSEFSPGQVLTNINDLESICVNMEHSWARDLEIKITCPNGTVVILHDHPANVGSEVLIGVPNDGDNFNPIPGTGYDYCWVHNAPRPTWLQYANTVLGGAGSLPSGSYSSFTPLTNLIGCPLNGEWTLTVTDFWAADNGYIFSWGIDFNDQLYPNIETFQQTLVNWQWSTHPTIFYQTPDSIAASPQNAGTAAYTFQVVDGFGCQWDTTVGVTVLPFTHPNCFECDVDYLALRDTAICEGASVTLHGGPVNNEVKQVRFEAAPGYPIGAGNHPHSNPYQSPVAVSSLGYSILSNPLTQINSVCLDLNTDFDADIYLYLRSPDNKQIELSTGNGGSGDNYKVTCFSPVAVTPITSGMAPFNGTYRPEGNWSSLNGAQINGNWRLVVSDGFGLNQYGVLNSWSIGFNLDTTVSYVWTPAISLSCTNCANPVATPSTTTTYIKTATDLFACTHRDTVTVTVGNFLPGPTGLSVVEMQNGSMTWIWNSVGGASSYEVRVNGGPWVVVGTNSYTVSGLTSGAVVDLEVRVNGGSPNCPPAIVAATQTYFECTLTATLNTVSPVTCPGGANGSVDITTTGAQGTLAYYASVTPGIPYTNGQITQLPAGSHFVYALDNMGCRDTVFFTISAPNAFNISITPTTVACSGGQTGTLSALVSGGTGAYTYTWTTCGGNPVVSGTIASGLSAGCYRLVVSDANACTASSTATVTENPPLTLQMSQNAALCYGAASGSAQAVVTGGLAPYQLSWTNGATAGTIQNVLAGFYAVTVTDAANCTLSAPIEVLQPTELLIDSLVVRAESCHNSSNGTAALYVNGGTPGYTYTWSGLAATESSVTNLNSGMYTVTVRDLNGCTATSVAQINEPAALMATVVALTDASCFNACNGALTVQVIGGTAPYSIQWNTPTVPPNGLNLNMLCAGAYAATVTDDNSCSVTIAAQIDQPDEVGAALFSVSHPTCPGAFNGSITITGVSGGSGGFTYLWSTGANTPSVNQLTCSVYTVTTTDVNGCSKETSIALQCPNALMIDQISGTPVSCNGGNNGTASITVAGGTAPYQYQWSAPGIGDTPAPAQLTAGTYTVTVTDVGMCSITATVTINTPVALTASVATTPVTCYGGADGTATVTAVGGTLPYAYLWNNQQTTVSAIQLASGEYQVTITDDKGCTETLMNIAVIQPAAPIVVTTANPTLACYGMSNGAATGSATGGNGAPYVYQWSTGSTGLLNGVAAGNYTLTVSDSKGCIAESSVFVAEYDSMTVNIATIPPSCFGVNDGQAAVNLVEGGAGGGVLSEYFFQWSGVTGAPSGAYWGAIPGNTPVSLLISDQQGCTGVAQLVLPAPTRIVPAFEVKSVSCAGLSDASITVVSYQGDQPIDTYFWTNGSTSAVAENLVAGTYSVTLTDTKGCTGTGSALVTAPQPLQISLQSNPVACFGDNNGTITATVTGGTSAYQYLWSNGASTAQLTQLPAGTFTLTVTDANQCSLQQTTTVASPDAPVISVATIAPDCYGAPEGRLTVTVSGANPPYRYGLGNGALGGSPVFLALKAGVYAVKIQDIKGCVYSAEGTVTQPDPLVVTFDPGEIAVTYGDTISLSPLITGANGVLQLEWDADLIETLICLDTPACRSIRFLPNIDNTIYVTATDEKGCIGTSAVRIKVDKPQDIYVPTGFTPNTDNANDRLHIFGKNRQVERITRFKVFDRWGELVYEDVDIPINDLQRGWDGTFRGKDCLPGIYVWTLEALFQDGTKKDFYGQTTLLR